MPHRSTMGHLVARPATVFAIVIAIAGCGGTGPTAVPTGPATSARATPAASPSSAAAGSPTPSTAAATGSATPSASDAGWRLVQLPDAGPVGMISDIASLPGAVVAAGVGPPSGANGVAWTSVDDGATWTSEPVPGAAGVLVRLTPWGDRLLAIGESGGDTGCAHPSTVLIRVRDPGGTWAAAPSDDLFCAGGLPGAAVSGARAVVVGAGTGDTAYAWSSEDGLHWTDRSGAFDGRIPQGVAVDGSGFVAFGSGFDAAPPWSSRSADGATWPRPQPLTDLTGLTMVGNPVVLDGHPVVFVADPTGAIGLLRPEAGGGSRSEPVNGLSRATLARIVAVEGGLVAFGGEGGPAASVSTDGVSWRAVTLPREAVAGGAGAILTGATIADGRAYLVGQIPVGTGAASRSIGALWTGPAALLQP